jgi:hypothetical protein
VRLLIIDEVHLLNDDRGAVIETLVARTLRQVGAVGPLLLLLLLLLPLAADLIASLPCSPLPPSSPPLPFQTATHPAPPPSQPRRWRPASP